MLYTNGDALFSESVGTACAIHMYRGKNAKSWSEPGDQNTRVRMLIWRLQCSNMA